MRSVKHDPWQMKHEPWLLKHDATHMTHDARNMQHEYVTPGGPGALRDRRVGGRTSAAVEISDGDAEGLAGAHVPRPQKNVEQRAVSLPTGEFSCVWFPRSGYSVLPLSVLLCVRLWSLRRIRGT